ncbi:Uncharacterized protein conserved in bacteria [Metamycoplasma arthritidis]|uniref:type II CRISPR RNA-guided endonuclease Cas9 n=1 Tax=Metamycoplasma arthritidis TaxID=2111 RepID=UPI00030D0A12|nr:type II CRISPR RNA-guided endonuclease Cas9 [Metamycoplasma arthritidis]VEU78916.1 Uncharacterized protein conserved in bacteria [Metamycoplasma arthritidis]
MAFYQSGIKDLSFLTLDLAIEGIEKNSPSWLNVYDNIAQILSKSIDVDTRASELKEYFKKTEASEFLNSIKDDEFEFEKLAEILSLNLAKINNSYSLTSSLSFKALRLFIPKLAKTTSNEEELKFKDPDIKSQIAAKNQEPKKTKYIDAKQFDDAVLPPSVKRTIKEAIGVLNQIIKLYSNNYEIAEIVVEMARDKNSKEETNRINKENKSNKKSNQEIIKEIKKHVSEDKYNSLPISTKEKIKLLLQQKCKDVYDCQTITIEDVIRKPHLYEIDHIIPITVLPDNSFANKVITKQKNNQAKSNRTPYEWLGSDAEKWSELESYWSCTTSGKIKENWNINYFPNKESLAKKIKYLSLNNKYELDDFLNRSLNDTRHSTKLFVDVLKAFFNNSSSYKEDAVDNVNSKNKKVKISTTKGALTSLFRKCITNKLLKNYNLPIENCWFKKDRDKFFHHAIDASLIVFINKYYLSQVYGINVFYKDKRTGLILENAPINGKEHYEKFLFSNGFKKTNDDWARMKFDETMNKIIEKITENVVEKVKYSRKILAKRTNGELFNKLRYGYTEISSDKKAAMKDHDSINKISKLSLLSQDESDLKKLETFFSDNANENDKSKLLIYKSKVGYSQYKLLKEIYNKAEFKQNELDGSKKNINPFENYMKFLATKIDEIPEFQKIIPKERFEALSRQKKFILMNSKFTKVIAIIQNLKYEFKTKTLDDVIFSKTILKKDGNGWKEAYFQESLTSFGCLVYKHKQKPKELKAVAINAKNLKIVNNHFKTSLFEGLANNADTPDKQNEVLNKIKSDAGIGDEYEFYTALFKSQIFERIKTNESKDESVKNNYDNLAYIVGISIVKRSTEITLYHLKENKFKKIGLQKRKRDSIRHNVNEFFKKFRKVDIDILGNIKRSK